ncbi:ATPase PAAT-like [Erethizon dorsatum]
METQTGDAGLIRRPTLASSLLLTRTGLGAQNFDWEELLAPPAPGQYLVSLKSSRSPQGGNPCFLYLTGDPKGEEEIDSVGLLSSARNMEVYVGEEYCGTSRGSSVCTILESSCCPVVKSSVCSSAKLWHTGDQFQQILHRGLLLWNGRRPICSYLGKILSKNMDLMGKKLMDYIGCCS